MREMLNENPWIAKALIGVVLLAALAFAVLRGGGDSDPYSKDRLTERVTIVDSETGDSWETLRARMEKELRLRPGQIDPAQGLRNPETGTPTGFPEDQADWAKTIDRLNAEKRAASEPSENSRRGSGG